MNGEDGQNGHPPDGSVLWAWIAEEQGETGVARLQRAWLPLVAFSREVLTDPRLVEALQEQADKDGQTVRLVRFIQAEEVLAIRPRLGT
jgi:2,4-dienoyl-CoA reductase-like NADH-dependent reductase (Old Yellow Enzyme family)